MSGQLYRRVIEQICRQEVTHKVEVGKKRHKKRKINMVSKCLNYDHKLPRYNE